MSRTLGERSADWDPLLEKALRGDRAALGRLLEERMGYLYGVCFRLLQNRDEAEEAVAESCYRAFTHFGSFRGEAQFATWLYRIATNVCLDMLRKRKKTIPTDSEGIEMHLVSPQKSAISLLVEEEEKAGLFRILDQLPPISRIILTLREMEDLSYEDVASRLGCSIGTVKSRLHRAKKQALILLERDPELKALLLRQND